MENEKRSADEDADEIPTFTNKTNSAKRFKTLAKPLYKLKISDLLNAPYDADNQSYELKNHRFNMIMCGGVIKDIFRDDVLFHFELDDGTGAIRCFYKHKQDINAYISNFNDAFQSFQNENTIVENVTVFDGNDTVLRKTDESRENISEVCRWFQDKILSKSQDKNIGDIVHLIGHLNQSDSFRKINILEFRIVENECEHQDFREELSYLYKNVY